MSNFLLSFFVKDKNPDTPYGRYCYGRLCGWVGIILNLLLVIIKVFIGYITGSISVISDALNNLSDAGSSVITLAGFKISIMPADEKHPYGHGRFEYLSSFAIALAIIFIGIEFVKTSVLKIINPTEVHFSWVAVTVLLVSALFKLWLALFNRKVGKIIKSGTLTAVYADSISDMVTTSVIAVSLIIYKVTHLPIDGYLGTLVSFYVIFSGIVALKNTIDELLGKPPSKEVVLLISDKIRSYPGIVGVHDLIIHEYGPGRCFVTAHAEVSSDTDVMESHDLVDIIERELKNEYGYNVTLHMDPIITNNAKINETRKMVEDIVKEVEPSLGIHDFRMVEGPKHTNLIFDVEMPYSVEKTHDEITNSITEKIREKDKKYYTVITVDRNYI